MAKTRGRSLKVFQAQFGFYDSVVAAPSQAAALRAWGTHQNLFADGQAQPATNEADVAAALEHPEKPLRRAVGSNEPFSLEPTSLPTMPDLPKRQKPRVKPALPTQPAADRSKLDAAEAALRALDEGREHEEEDLRREEKALKEKQAAAQTAYVKARGQAKADVLARRTEYRKAGGSD